MDKNAIMNRRESPIKVIGKGLLKFFTLLLAILFVIVAALYAVMWVLIKGPSPTAQRLFIMSARETSAMKWLPNMYLSEPEIISIIGVSEPDMEVMYEMDTSLITLPPVRRVLLDNDDVDEADQDIDEIFDDGDGLELFDIVGSGYRGYMLVVDDPSRLFVGTPTHFGSVGVRLVDMVERTGAVAGVNAGGFYDPDGVGMGGIPDGIVICDGEIKWGADNGYVNVIGFDADGLLHVGYMTPNAALNLGLQWAVSFGPTLISNGVAPDRELLRSGINPRTAIGQRADGAVLLLVIDGRQIDSLGATFEDMVEIFLEFGAVNAANLDGGSSTLMVFEGELINNCASVAGPRPIPTAFLVR